ncbi:MAG: Rrf2 family transcriptional regulator [Verrucomicrobia bacterium]|nr:Rrf2 family transcriptional regulator [Verrucomicrobiota bacterium]MDE3100249.1 Rrf2 family transcriptional regulator [Verrucomicrobiota bacterium]
MQLSAYSDYAIRVLMQTALCRPERTTVAEVAETFGISRHHLVKVVHDLGRHGYLATQRGIGGGFMLARAPEAIRLGDIVRLGEESDTVIDCHESKHRFCRLLPACQLKGILDEAAGAFFETLDRHTLADLIRQPSRMRAALGICRTQTTAPSRRRYSGAEYEI